MSVHKWFTPNTGTLTPNTSRFQFLPSRRLYSFLLHQQVLPLALSLSLSLCVSLAQACKYSLQSLWNKLKLGSLMRHSSRFITYVFVRSHCIGLFSTETESTAQSTRFTCVALVFRFLVRHREKRGRVNNLKQKASLKTSKKARTGHRCIAQIPELYPCRFRTPRPRPPPSPPPRPFLSTRFGPEYFWYCDVCAP